MNKLFGGLLGIALLVGGVYFASELVWGSKDTNNGDDGDNGENEDTKELSVTIDGEGMAELTVDGEWEGPYGSGTYEFPEGSTIEVSADPAIGWETISVIPKEDFVLNENKSVSLYFSMDEF